MLQIMSLITSKYGQQKQHINSICSSFIFYYMFWSYILTLVSYITGTEGNVSTLFLLNVQSSCVVFVWTVFSGD